MAVTGRGILKSPLPAPLTRSCQPSGFARSDALMIFPLATQSLFPEKAIQNPIGITVATCPVLSEPSHHTG